MALSDGQKEGNVLSVLAKTTKRRQVGSFYIH